MQRDTRRFYRYIIHSNYYYRCCVLYYRHKKTDLRRQIREHTITITEKTETHVELLG